MRVSIRGILRNNGGISRSVRLPSPCYRTTSLSLRSKANKKFRGFKAFFGEIVPCPHHGRRHETRMRHSGLRGVPKVRSKAQPQSISALVAVVDVVLVVDAGEIVYDYHRHLGLSISSEGWDGKSRGL